MAIHRLLPLVLGLAALLVVAFPAQAQAQAAQPEFLLIVDRTEITEGEGPVVLNAKITARGFPETETLRVDVAITNAWANRSDFSLTGWKSFSLPPEQREHTLRLEIEAFHDALAEDTERINLVAKVATSGWSMSTAHTLHIVDLPPATGGRAASPALHSPQNVRWNVSGEMISITWEPSPVAQGRGFRIEGEAVDEWGDGRGTVALPIVLGPQARNFVQTGLVPGQPYRYRLWSEGAEDDLPVEIVFSPPAVLDWQPDSLPNIAYGITKEGVFSWQHPPKEYAGQVYLVRWVSSPRRLQSEEAHEWLSRPWAPNQGQTWVPASECLQMCELTIPDWDPTLHWSVQVRSTLGNPQEWWDWTRWDPTDQWGPATPPSELLIHQSVGILRWRASAVAVPGQEYEVRWVSGDRPPAVDAPPDGQRIVSEAQHCGRERRCSIVIDNWDASRHYLIRIRTLHHEPTETDVAVRSSP